MEIKSSLPVVYHIGSPPDSVHSGETPSGSSGLPQKQRQFPVTVSGKQGDDTVEISEWRSEQLPDSSGGIRNNTQEAGRYEVSRSVAVDGNTNSIAGRPDDVYSTYNSLGKVPGSQKSPDAAKGLIIDIWI